jgi:hypothetical protein
MPGNVRHRTLGVLAGREEVLEKGIEVVSQP